MILEGLSETGVPEPQGALEWVRFRPKAEWQIKQHPLAGSGAGGQDGGLDRERLQMRRERGSPYPRLTASQGLGFPGGAPPPLAQEPKG